MVLVPKTRLFICSLIFMAACSSTPSATVAEVQTVRVQSEGWDLTGSLVVPASDEPTPIALLLHKAAGNNAEYRDLQSELKSRGIASLALDLRGHGQSTNLGSFNPDDRATRAILEGTESDVIAAHKWIEDDGRFDPRRVVVVGASYSGEHAAIAGRDYKMAAAYVQFSPGSISDETIENIDATGVPWLFIRGEIEFSFFDEIFELIDQHSETAEVWIEPGKGHATNLLTLHPDLNGRLADWIEVKLN